MQFLKLLFNIGRLFALYLADGNNVNVVEGRQIVKKFYESFENSRFVYNPVNMLIDTERRPSFVIAFKVEHEIIKNLLSGQIS